MKVVLNGVILESTNELVIEQWKKQGLKEVPAKPKKKKTEEKETAVREEKAE